MTDLAPRLLFRRLVALVIDYVVLTGPVMLLLVALLPNPLRFDPGLLRFTYCKPLTTLPPLLEGTIAPDRIAALRRCDTRGLIAPPITTVKLFFDRGSQGQMKNLAVTMTADLDGFGLVLPRQPFALLALILLSTAFSANGMRSPGKALMGLRLIAPPNTPPLRFLQREVLRVLPLMLLGLVSLTMQIWHWQHVNAAALQSGLAMFDEVVQVGFFRAMLPSVLLALAVIIGLLWYYDWLTLRWRGALRHDRICGFTLRRTGQDAPPQGCPPQPYTKLRFGAVWPPQPYTRLRQFPHAAALAPVQPPLKPGA